MKDAQLMYLKKQYGDVLMLVLSLINQTEEMALRHIQYDVLKISFD